jgi:cytochrome P450
MDLKYLDCCFNEGLRIEPSSETAYFWVDKEIKVGPYTFRRNEDLMIFIHGIHYSP